MVLQRATSVPIGLVIAGVSSVITSGNGMPRNVKRITIDRMKQQYGKMDRLDVVLLITSDPNVTPV